MNSMPTSCRFVAATPKRHQSGFSLLEMGVALMAAGLVTVAAYTAHTSLKAKKDVTDAATLLQTIDTSIRSFVLREHRLPI